MTDEDALRTRRLRPIGGAKLEVAVVLVVYLVGIIKGVTDAGPTLEGAMMLLVWTLIWSVTMIALYLGWISYTKLLGRIWYGGASA